LVIILQKKASTNHEFHFSLGMDKTLLAKILSSATGRCWSVDTYNPVPGVMENVPSSNDYKVQYYFNCFPSRFSKTIIYQGGFGSSLMLKDLGLSQDAANRAGSSTPLGTMSHKIFTDMCDSGFAEKDFGSAFQYIKAQKR
jgi:3-hydroxyisobutyrate dehydrogenase-like beta-hydroxyacid dehydrogenase